MPEKIPRIKLFINSNLFIFYDLIHCRNLNDIFIHFIPNYPPPPGLFLILINKLFKCFSSSACLCSPPTPTLWPTKCRRLLAWRPASAQSTARAAPIVIRPGWSANFWVLEGFKCFLKKVINSALCPRGFVDIYFDNFVAPGERILHKIRPLVRPRVERAVNLGEVGGNGLLNGLKLSNLISQLI